MIIYKAENKIDGKIYIGKTVKSLESRKNNHIKDSINNRYNIYFHRALRKYGIDNFEWSVIDTALSETELNEKEIYWIAEYRKTHILYNMTNGGEGVSGLIHSEESKIKMSEKLKGRIPWNSGKKLSEETKLKISKSRKGKCVGIENGFFNKKHSEETINHFKEIRKGKPNNFLKGKKLSEEHCKKLSESHMGQVSWCKGLKLPELSEKRKGKGNPMYGKKQSPETIKKRIETIKKNKMGKIEQGELF